MLLNNNIARIYLLLKKLTKEIKKMSRDFVRPYRRPHQSSLEIEFQQPLQRLKTLLASLWTPFMIGPILNRHVYIRLLATVNREVS